MKDNQSSYRQIFKATSLFGGVQVINIIITLVRSKFIAVLLGPTGMGIVGLLTSTTRLIGGMTNFGLSTSAVRDVASANESGEKVRISRIVIITRRLVWITGILGAIVTFVLAPKLSDLTFGNDDYIVAFRWLSITLCLNQLTSGQNVILQGMRKLKHLAKANMVGSIIGLLVSVPIYYFWGIDGIVPAILISSVFALVIAWYFAAKIKTNKVPVSGKETFREGRGMLEIGFMLSLSGLITLAASYIIRIYISKAGGVDDVGFYNAGFSIINTYVGLVFTAMSADYYPRLSGIAHDNKKARLLISQQAEVATLILGPILSVFLIFINFAVILLYSTEFSPINGMIHWAALGLYFKAASWTIGFLFLAKGASKVFFLSELASNSYMLLLNILGYKFFGLDGLGVSFLVGYVIYLIQVYLIARIKYGFAFTSAFYKVFIILFTLGLMCFLTIKLIPAPWAYIVGVPFIVLSTWFAFKGLDERMGLKTILEKRMKNFRPRGK